MQDQQQQSHEVRLARQTLPRNFTFHYQDGQPPKTPEPAKPRELPTETLLPPKLRIRKRRTAGSQNQFDFKSSMLPLPTIELPEFESQFAPILNDETSDLQDGYLAPATSRSLKRYGRIMDAPKTPLDQIFNAFDEAYGNNVEWTPHRPVEPITRPSSAFSDSDESDSSSDSSPSFEESCTSPDVEHSENFVFPSAGANAPTLSSPLHFHTAQKTNRRLSSYHKIRWTPDMDEHLWQTYTSYLADPTVTPFKMLPGTAPPLGVCHRVARDAKKTWKGSRNSLLPIAEDRQSYPYISLDAALARESSALPVGDLDSEAVKTSRPQLTLRSLSSNDMLRRNLGRWPRSEASTRRRLRELCKRKPTLSPHYQRLMQPRSPSPFASSSTSSKAEKRSSRFTSPVPHDSDSAFSTRDLNITLATTTAPSMQPDGPLSQLTSETMKPRPYSSDWNPRSGRRSGAAHQKSQSLHLSLGIGLSSHQINSFRRLASPFQDPFQSGESPLPAMPENEPLPPQNPAAALHQIHQPRPLSGSMKRRAQYPLGEEMVSNDVDTRRSFLEGLFRNQDTEGHRRVRSRGFSVGAVRHSYSSHGRHLSDVFSPSLNTDRLSVSPPLPEVSENPHPDTEMQHAHVSSMEGNLLAAPPIVDHIRRLGSPFAPSANQRFSRTFPRSAFPEGLDSIAALEQQQQQQQYGQ